MNHFCVVNYIFNIKSHVKITKKSRVDYSTSLGFDLTVTTTLCPLILGGHIIIYDSDVKDLKSYTEYLLKNKINFVKLTPSYFELLTNILPSTTIDKIILGGEKFNHNLLTKLDKAENNNLIIYDEYGPTEATVGTCIAQIYPNYDMTIGRPYHNNKVYILDKNLQPLPIGATGELYIGGVCVAKNYLNNKKLTKEKFIKNSFCNQGKLYKTGDLVRYLNDGRLEYLGRKDNQIKLHGYRIELEEIETILTQYDGINQAIIIVAEYYNNRHLVAYYVSDHAFDEIKIKNFLKQKLPEYMIPNYFIHLQKVPLNINGKIDHKKLPVPQVIKKDEYKSPRNETEKQVCKLYAETIGMPIENVGIEDSFFKLGGNSILAIKLIAKINNLYLSNLRVVDIFVNTTVASLSLRIAQVKNIYQPIVHLNYSCDLPNLFMIHPGASGCEVYFSLADKLTNYFSCYGVDSYNLYSKNKITDITSLANYYLEYIDEVMNNTNQSEYHILGWSLGGQIGLEIAKILENRGNTKIKLYLLDVILDDNYLLSLRTNLDLESLKADYLEYAEMQGYDSSYTEKIIINMDAETALIRKQVEYLSLFNTDILLFKAMLSDIDSKIEEFKKIYEYSITLEYNNINRIVSDESKIRLVKLVDFSHNTILKAENLMINEIISYLNKQ